MVLMMKIKASALIGVVKNRKESPGVLHNICSFLEINVDTNWKVVGSIPIEAIF
jgi:hypothetical protein